MIYSVNCTLSKITPIDNIVNYMIPPLTNKEIKRSVKPESYPKPLSIPIDLIDWVVAYDAYKPIYHIDPKVLSAKWADPEDFSLVNKKVWSKSYDVNIDASGKPLNPFGRIGIEGRGLLGKWGANYAVDILLYRIMNDEKELLLIKRDDNHLYAFVGGMIDGEETELQAAERELKEETELDLSLDNAEVVYRGTAGDYRNTDNAWIETTVFLMDVSEKTDLHPVASDDAEHVEWVKELDVPFLKMHGSHQDILEKIIKNDSH